jgi:hypothetical protein
MLQTDQAEVRVVETRIRQIINCEAEAERHTAKANDLRWKAAQLMVEELAGKSQTQLAKDIGKSEGHVSFCVKAWRLYHDKDPRPRWQEAYDAAQNRKGSKRGKSKKGKKSKGKGGEKQKPNDSEPLRAVWSPVYIAEQNIRETRMTPQQAAQKVILARGDRQPVETARWLAEWLTEFVSCLEQKLGG